VERAREPQDAKGPKGAASAPAAGTADAPKAKASDAS